METKEVLERWEFKVEYEEGEDQGEGSKENVSSNVTSQKAAPITSEKGYRNVSNKVLNKKITHGAALGHTVGSEYRTRLVFQWS